jgi:hypothetical protein
MWEIGMVFVALAALYAFVAVLKPIKPFKRRWTAAAAVFALLVASGQLSDAHLAYLQEHDPEEYAAVMAEREAREADREARKAERAAREAAEEAAEQRERDQAAQERRQREEQAAAESARSDRRLVAMSHCQEELTKRAKYPSEVEFPWFDWNYRENGARGIFISRAKLMNGFGAKIPHTFKCVYDVRDPDRMVLRDFQMSEG